mgnify:CR=1 FL=1
MVAWWRSLSRSVRVGIVSALLGLLGPVRTYAGGSLAEVGGGGGPFEELLANTIVVINEVFIPFIIGIGFLVFVWGMFVYFIYGGANEDAKEKGRSLMVYAVLAFVLMIIFWGIVNLIAASIGLQDAELDATGAVTPFTID